MKIHIVQKGDTLWELAKKYGVNFEELKKLNSQLSSPDMIMPGMKIKIPGSVKEVKKETVKKEQKVIKETQKAEHPYKDISPKPMPVIKEDDQDIGKVLQPEMPLPLPQMPQMPLEPIMPAPIIKEKPVKEKPIKEKPVEKPKEEIQPKVVEPPQPIPPVQQPVIPPVQEPVSPIIPPVQQQPFPMHPVCCYVMHPCYPYIPCEKEMLPNFVHHHTMMPCHGGPSILPMSAPMPAPMPMMHNQYDCGCGADLMNDFYPGQEYQNNQHLTDVQVNPLHMNAYEDYAKPTHSNQPFHPTNQYPPMPTTTTHPTPPGFPNYRDHEDESKDE